MHLIDRPVPDRHGICLLLACVVALCALALFAPAALAAADGRALVEFSAATSAAQAKAVAAAHDAVIVREIPRDGFEGGKALYLVSAPDVSSAALAEALQAEPAVTRASADHVVTADTTFPNDPGDLTFWSLIKVQAPQAWDLTTGSPGVVVGILDTGITYTHPDLAANMWQNPAEIAGNGVDDDGDGFIDDVCGIDVVNNDGDPMDDSFHGTHVSGIVAAVGNNGKNVVGVCWTARLMALKCLDTSFKGSTSGIIQCIYWAIQQKQLHGVNIVAINGSWGGDDFPYDPLLLAAIRDAGSAGIVYVTSAGNDGRDTDAQPRYPSCYDASTIVSVAASANNKLTGGDEALTSWSNYGATTVDLAAPGDQVLSTYPPATQAYLSGTSMAAPHVTGAIALCAAYRPAETALQRIDRVMTGVDQLPSMAGKLATGGRLNVYKALTADIRPVTTVAGVDGAWHTSPVTATFTASDSTGIGVLRTEYGVDGSAYQTGTSATIGSDGVHTLRYRSVDKAQNVEDARDATVKVDATAPQVVTSGGASWTNSQATVHLTATDATSGVAGLEYRLAGDAQWTAGDPAGTDVTIATEGDYTVQCRATDVAGNVSATAEATLRIDKTAPTAAASGVDDAWHATPVTVTLTAADALGAAHSGVALIQYRAAGAADWTSVAGDTAGVLVPAAGPSGTRSYEYRAVDRAGNVSATAGFSVKMDAVAPVTTVTGADSAWHKAPVMLTFSATDAGGIGVARTEYSLDGVSWVPGTILVVSAEGVTTVSYRSADLLGNIEATRTAQVRIDTVAPTTRCYDASVVRNRTATLTYRVNDALPTSGSATVTAITIRNANGSVVKLFSGVGTVATNTTATFRFTANLSPGTYTYLVSARDAAGNIARTLTQATLIVRVR